MAEPKNGLWLLDRADSFLLSVAEGIVERLCGSLGAPFITIGAGVGLQFSKDVGIDGGLNSCNFAIEVNIREGSELISIGLYDLLLEEEFDIRDDSLKLVIGFDTGDPEFFDKVDAVLKNAWEQEVGVFDRSALADWLKRRNWG